MSNEDDITIYMKFGKDAFYCQVALTLLGMANANAMGKGASGLMSHFNFIDRQSTCLILNVTVFIVL